MQTAAWHRRGAAKKSHIVRRSPALLCSFCWQSFGGAAESSMFRSQIESGFDEDTEKVSYGNIIGVTKYATF